MFKIVLGAVLSVLALVFIFQNMQTADVTFLAWTISMSRALMLLIVLLVGFILGWVVPSIGRRRRAAARKNRENT